MQKRVMNSSSRSLNGRGSETDQSMILATTDTAEIEKMENATSYREGQLANNEGKSSYSKRSSVVELWKKREGTIKAANALPKDRAQVMAFEEKKENNQDIVIDSEQDSRQQEKNANSQEGSERNGPESTVSSLERGTESSKNTVTSAPRRASIRDSWKKRAANIPSPSAQQSLRVVTTADVNVTENSELNGPSPRSKSVTDVKSPNTGTEKSIGTRSAEPSPTASSSSFNELKSKWAKFGVQTESGGNQPSESTPRTSLHSPARIDGESDAGGDKGFQNEALKMSPRSFTKSRSFVSQRSNSFNADSNARVVLESPQLDINEKEKRLPISPRVSKDKVDTESHSSETASKALASRRLASKTFRSKYSRRPSANSPRGADQPASPTENLTTEENVGSPIQPFPSNKKEYGPSSPLNEATENDTKSSLSPYMSKNRDVYARSRSFDLKQSRVSTSPGLRIISSTDDGSTTIEGSPTVSRSTLSSRASRRLRDIRLRQQTQGKDECQDGKDTPSHDTNTGTNTGIEVDEPSQESQIQEPGHIPSPLASSLPKSQTNESNGSTFISIGGSSAFSPHLCAESTYENAQIDSTCAFDFNARNGSADGAKDNPKSPLHNVVPDVNEMIPDEFVSEKNAHFDSFKTAYDNTSFSQLAKDMTAEASSIFGLDIHAAINNLGDMFQTQSPKKVIKRSPSPLEEVAIEVEYVADSD